MSLGIFSFDLAALLRSLDQYFDPPAPELPTEQAQPDEGGFGGAALGGETVINDAEMSRILDSAVTSVILAGSSKPVAVTTAKPPLTAEIRAEIERLARELGMQVVHNYRDADVAAEDLSRRLVVDRPRSAEAEDGASVRRRDDARRENLRSARREDEKRRGLHDLGFRKPH